LNGHHRYLRAYLAGIAFPTAFLAVLLSIFVTFAVSGYLPWSLSALLIFPMAVVPNVWGLWNMLYAALREHRPRNIGLFGAALPAVLAPLGYTLATAMGRRPPFGWPLVGVGLFVAVIVYYLLWKHVVSFMNETLELE
jgi:hypothetical protein